MKKAFHRIFASILVLTLIAGASFADFIRTDLPAKEPKIQASIFFFNEQAVVRAPDWMELPFLQHASEVRSEAGELLLGEFLNESRASNINMAARNSLAARLEKVRKRGMFGVLSVAMEMPVEKDGKAMKRQGPGGGGQGKFMSEQPWAVSQRSAATSVFSPLFYDDILYAYAEEYAAAFGVRERSVDAYRERFGEPALMKVALAAYSMQYGAEHLMDIELPINGGTYPLSVFLMEQDGVPVLRLFDPSGRIFRRLYSMANPDSIGGYLEAVLLPLAAIEVTRWLNIEYEAMHFNDWQAALGPVFLTERYKNAEWPLGHRPAATFTIHNLEYQGKFAGAMRIDNKLEDPKLIAYLKERGILKPDQKEVDLFGLTGLDRSVQSDIENGLEYYSNDVPGQHNLMKGAVVSRRSEPLFVSEGHAQESLDPVRGYGLHGVFNQIRHSIRFVYNGVRADRNQPQNLKELTVDEFTQPPKPLSRMDPHELLEWKISNRLALQKKLGLEISKDNMVLGFVTRIVKQKGLNILMTPMPDSGKTLLEEILDFEIPGTNGKIQIPILGSAGDAVGESQAAFFRNFLESHPKYKGQFVFIEQFDPVLAKQIGAGSDMVGMFSIDEPGGIANQELALLLAMVIATDRGGLKDFKKRGGTPQPLVSGFEIDDSPEAQAQRIKSSEEILHILKDVFFTYHNQPAVYAEEWLKPLSKFKAAWGDRAGDYIEAYKDAIDTVRPGFRDHLSSIIRSFVRQNVPAPSELIQSLRVSSGVRDPDRVSTRKMLNQMKQRASTFRGARVLDLTTDSGALAIYAALLGAREVYAVDKNDAALEDVRANAEKWEVQDFIQTVHKDLRHDRVEDLGSFDIVLMDPDPLYEPRTDFLMKDEVDSGALAVDGNGELLYGFINDIAHSAISEHGGYALIYADMRAEEKIRAEELGLNALEFTLAKQERRRDYAVYEITPEHTLESQLPGALAMTEKSGTLLPPLADIKKDPELSDVEISADQLHAFRGLFEEMAPPSRHADRMNRVLDVMKLDVKNPADVAIASSLASLWFSASKDDLAEDALLKNILGNEANKNGLTIRFAEAGALNGAQSAWYADPSDLHKSIIVVDGSFMLGLRQAGRAWSEADLDLSLSLLGQLLAERIWVHEAAHQRVGATLVQQQKEELRIMWIEKAFNRGTQQAFGAGIIESMLEKVRAQNPAAYEAIHAARRYRLYRSILSTLIPGEERLERLVVRLYDSFQPYGAAMQTENPGSDARIRKKQVVSLSGTKVEIREGGNVSIDITRSPAPTKVTAMQDFLHTNGFRADQGVYIGNQTSSPQERDGILTQIPGLSVLAVDADQSKVISQARPIGVGPAATLAYVRTLLSGPQEKLPAFIGLDVDDTILLGTKEIKSGTSVMRTKESLLEDRPELAQALVELIGRGVKIAFFSDGDSQATKDRIALPLVALLSKSNSYAPVAFYTSGMVTKFVLRKDQTNGPSLTDDASYGKEYRLSAETVALFSKILGSVSKAPEGAIEASGLVGRYYTERLAEPIEGVYHLRPAIRNMYPDYKPLLTAHGHTRLPEVQFRDLASDGSAAQISILPVVSFWSGPNTRLEPRQADERTQLFDAIVEALRQNGVAGVSDIAQVSKPLDEALVGKALADGTVLTESMLQKVRSLMGVSDLVAAQRIPQQPQAAVERARLAIGTITRKLQAHGSTLEEATPEQFRALFGVMPVIVAAGHATRFSSFLHKVLTRAGLDKTNIGFTLEGTYCTPGMKRTILISDKVLGLLVRDNHDEKYLTGYDQRYHFFTVKPELTDLPAGRRARVLSDHELDPEQVLHYFGLPMDQLTILYARSYGHGDALLNAIEAMDPVHSPAYVQIGFGEMSPAILPTLSCPSFITYLETLARDADAVAGGKRSDSLIEGKGNFFFDGQGHLLSFTDWEQIPHKDPQSKFDKVAGQWANQQTGLEERLGMLPSNAERRQQVLAQVRNRYPQFTISEDGVLFCQEFLEEAKKAVSRWSSLPDSEKRYWRSHVAIAEESDGKRADLLISANASTFRMQAIRDILPETRRLFEEGGFAHYQPGQPDDPRRVNGFWGVDPKSGETKTLAWNVLHLLAARARAQNHPDAVGMVYVGEAPSSIKDPQRQLEFAREVRALQRPPMPAAPLSTEEDRDTNMIAEFLRAGHAPAASLSLVDLLMRGNGSAATFRRIIQALLRRSHGAAWQGPLLGILQALPDSHVPVFDQLAGSWALGRQVVLGAVEQVLAEAVDAGWIDPRGSPEAGALAQAYHRSQDKGREEYLATRIGSLEQPTASGAEHRRQDLLRIVGGNSEALEDLLRRNMRATHMSLESLVTENRLPQINRDHRPSPLKAPEAFAMVGGTSGNFFTGVLPEIISTTPATREVRLNTIIGLSPYDDGGGSRKIMDQMLPFLGPIPPPGDEMNVMAGLTSPRKRFIVRFRTDKKESGTLKDKMITALQYAYRGVDQDGNIFTTEPVEDDWITFCHHMLNLAEMLDDYYVKEGKLSIANNSLGNFMNLAMKLYTGAYNPQTKKIDAEKYSEAIQRLLHLMGIYDIHIVPSSFVHGTLYALLKAPSIRIGDDIHVLDDATLSKGTVKINGHEVAVGRNAGGDPFVTIGSQRLVIGERFSADGLIRRDSKGPSVSDSHTVVQIFEADRLLEEKILANNGQGVEFQVGGVSVKVKGRLVIEQTSITDSMHDSPIVKIGLINGVAPRANPGFVKLLRECKDIVVMGPGSLVTSLMPELLSPDIVETLLERRRQGLPTALVVNPFRDNETVDYRYADLVHLVENTTGHRFEELFSNVIANDVVGLARQSLQGDDHEETRDRMIHMLALMNKMAANRSRLSEARSPDDFSSLAKYSRGVMGATDAEVDHLKRLLTIGEIPEYFELADIRELRRTMKERGVTLNLRPMATIIRQEERKAGGPHYTEGVGYHREVLGEVLDEILMQLSRHWSVYPDLVQVFGNDVSVLESEVARMMGLFPKMTRRDIMNQMHEWWIKRQWPSATPLLTRQQAAKMRSPKVIIANVAYTLLWLDSKHRSKDAEPRLVNAFEDYLRSGGILVLLSGFSAQTVNDRLVQKIAPDLRHRIVIAASGGAVVRLYDSLGEMQSPTISFEHVISEQDRDIWFAIARKVCREFELDKPLFSLSGKKLDDSVHLDEREGEFTIEVVGRTNLPSGVAERINERLKKKGMADFLIEKQGGYYDIRPAIVRRIQYYLEEYKLSVNIMPAIRGPGAINMTLMTPTQAWQTLHAQQIIETLAGGPVDSRDFVLIGRRKEELGDLLPDAQWLIFNVSQSPEHIPDGVRMYQGPPGAIGVAEFVEELVKENGNNILAPPIVVEPQNLRRAG